jgi:hypothetical protein
MGPIGTVDVLAGDVESPQHTPQIEDALIVGLLILQFNCSCGSHSGGFGMAGFIFSNSVMFSPLVLPAD